MTEFVWVCFILMSMLPADDQTMRPIVVSETAPTSVLAQSDTANQDSAQDCNAMGSSKIGEGVAEAIVADGKVRVFVMLAADKTNMQRTEIEQLQDQVLSSVSRAEFVSVVRYANIASMTGVVTRSGLTALAANPLVLKIDLDISGTGHDAGSTPSTILGE